MSPGGEQAPVYEIHAAVELSTPVLVVALEGWVDAGFGAATAITTLLSSTPTDRLATFDSDHFLDQRARRPTVRIVDGVTAELNWPQTEIRFGRDANGSDVLFLVGPEPDFHWHGFVEAVTQVALRYGVRMMVGLGAFPAPAPHTRPVKLAATAPRESSDLVHQIGIVQGELEVPAGVLAALELNFGNAGIAAVSLWARVPHYVAAMPFPDASAALITGLASLTGLGFDPSNLRGAVDSSRRQVDDLIAGNEEHLAMVRKLEENIDASEGNPLGIEEVPTGDELAEEFERFLRGEGQGDRGQ